jgi:iron(III) transport system permease protein
MDVATDCRRRRLALQHAFSTDAGFIDIYSLPGMIWVDGLHYSPMAFLLMTAAPPP